jgi:hypothetical protein
MRTLKISLLGIGSLVLLAVCPPLFVAALFIAVIAYIGQHISNKSVDAGNAPIPDKYQRS